MTNRLLHLLALLLLTFCLGAQAAPAEGRRVALVIGNAKYPGSPLKNPVNDARAIAVKLKALGFEVILKEDIPLKDMSRAVTQFGEKLAQGGGTGLFYFAGHGIQAKGKNYLIPIDAQIGSESSVRSETLDVDVVLEQLSSSPLNIVILDACRNNPFERRFRSGGGGGLAQMDAPKGTLIAYATAPGRVAMDGEGRNGIYTAELLTVLDEPNLKVEDIFKRVRVRVAKATSDQQVPWESSSLTGDFYFRPGKGAAAAVAVPEGPAAPAVSEGAVELAFWESAEKGNTVPDYEAYLRKFPAGQFVDLARNRMTRLKGGGVQVASIAPGAGSVTGVRSERVELPPLPKLGDFWRYRGRNPLGADAPTYRVSRVEPGLIELSFVTNNNDATTLVLNGEWNPIGQRGGVDMTFKPFMPQCAFPLVPGRTWGGHYSTDCGFLCSVETDAEATARGWETVTVPAGTFETLRIDYREVTSYGTGTGTLWYSPEVRRPVKHDYRMSGMSYNYELEAFQLAP